MRIASPWQAVLSHAGWRNLDDIFRLESDTCLSKPGLPSWRERLRVSLTDPAGQPETVYIKRFHDVPWGEQVRRWLRGEFGHGTAWTEWRWMGELADAGLPVAEPIALGEEMAGCWERRSAVVIRAVPGESLERWCAKNQRRLPGPVAGRLADLAAQFHARGIAHRDFYLAHVFGDGLDTDTPQLKLIDLQRVIRVRLSRWIVKDLAALHYSTPPTAATASDRLRWFKRYLATAGRRVNTRGRLDRRERALLRRIIGRTEHMRRHDARRGK